MKNKIVFLYSELSGYFLSCANSLVKKNSEVHIVRWPVNKEAPFKLNFGKKIFIYEKDDFPSEKLLELVQSINPSIIVASGWMDKSYLSICKWFKGKIPTIISMDNHWKGTIKQHLATLLSPFFLHNTYSHIWIPGVPQIMYAKKLGFKPNQIITGFYSADVNEFSKIAEIKYQSKLPHRFLYVGRYVEQKGLDTLFNAFIELQNEYTTDWELWCVGTGPLKETAPTHEKIKHFGFKQPSELPSIIIDSGIFILPSRYEPWGVVVHEMAAASLPMIVSNKVGASTQYIQEGKNGFIFKVNDVTDLKMKMKKMISQPDNILMDMSKKSYELGISYTPENWSDTILKLL